MTVRCDNCGKRLQNVRLREKTHPRTFQPVRLKLCTPCARAGGWRDVNFDRGIYTTSILGGGA